MNERPSDDIKEMILKNEIVEYVYIKGVWRIYFSAAIRRYYMRRYIMIVNKITSASFQACSHRRIEITSTIVPFDPQNWRLN